MRWLALVPVVLVVAACGSSDAATPTTTTLAATTTSTSSTTVPGTTTTTSTTAPATTTTAAGTTTSLSIPAEAPVVTADDAVLTAPASSTPLALDGADACRVLTGTASIGGCGAVFNSGGRLVWFTSDADSPDPTAIAIYKALGDSLELHDAGSEWVPGVAAFDTAGHTPGHVSFELKDASGPVFVLGDALTHRIASFAHPEWSPATDHDAALAVATRRRLLDRAANEKAQVIGYHLDGAIGRVERDGSAYRFVTGS